MSVSSHVEELKKKHAILSEKVEQFQRRPGTDDLAIAELKKQKLKQEKRV